MASRTADHTQLVEQLITLVDQRLLDPLAILLGSDADTGEVRERIRADTEMWAAQLLGRDEHLATTRAAKLVAALYPSDEPFAPPAAWWRTPLGRTVARRVGHPGAQRVSYSVAGAMLGVTRQGVHDLVNRGKLTRDPEGGVRATSVKRRLEETSS